MRVEVDTARMPNTPQTLPRVTARKLRIPLLFFRSANLSIAKPITHIRNQRLFQAGLPVLFQRKNTSREKTRTRIPQRSIGAPAFSSMSRLLFSKEAEMMDRLSSGVNCFSRLFSMTFTLFEYVKRAGELFSSLSCCKYKVVYFINQIFR